MKLDDDEALISHLVSALRMSIRRFTAYGDGQDDTELLGMVIIENSDDDPVSLRIRRLKDEKSVGEKSVVEIYIFWAGAHPSEQTIQECRADVDKALAGFPPA